MLAQAKSHPAVTSHVATIAARSRLPLTEDIERSDEVILIVV
jgi:hypothetical protein